MRQSNCGVRRNCNSNRLRTDYTIVEIGMPVSSERDHRNSDSERGSQVSAKVDSLTASAL